VDKHGRVCGGALVSSRSRVSFSLLTLLIKTITCLIAFQILLYVCMFNIGYIQKYLD